VQHKVDRVQELEDVLRQFSMKLNMATLYLQDALDALQTGTRIVRGNDGVELGREEFKPAIKRSKK
jgi:hypothetical protein